MLALLLICAVVIEFAIYVGAGALAVSMLEWRVGWTVLLAVVVALLWRLLMVCAMFLLAWARHGEEARRTRLTLRRIVPLVFGEYVALLVIYLWLQPTEHFRRPDEPEPGAQAEGPIILLIHGYLCNGGFWHPVVRRLRQHGVRHVYTINLEPPFGSLNRFARLVAEYTAFLSESLGDAPVILVGHSMGGLVARAAVRERDMGERVVQVITLGTPHHGSVHAAFGFGQNAVQMRAGSAWLAGLNAGEPAPVPITSIYGLHDNLVAPQDSARLDHAKNIALAGVGHLAMAFSPRVHQLLLRAVKSAG